MNEVKVSAIKRLVIDAAKKKLDDLGAQYICPDDVGVHIIIQFDDTRIDFWPTTARWKRGNSMNTDTKTLWRLLGSKPNA